MLLSKEEQERYSRHIMLEGFGLEAQLKLKEARVLVVGAGGLGCPCLLYLTAAGIGQIGIADDDKVSLSNLQRQVLFNSSDIGKFKCEAAKEHLLAKNKNITITAYPEKISKENALNILKHFDVIIDGSDNFATRYLLNDACVMLNKPLVYGALFKFEGQVSTFNYQDGPTYRCLFPEPPAEGEMPGCGEVGVIGVLPGIIGTWQATEAVKIITGIGEPLRGKLLIMNLLSNEISALKFSAVPSNKQIKALGNYEAACATNLKEREIDAPTFLQWQEEKELQIIDVREEYEYERFNIGGENIPFSELEERLTEIRPSGITVVVCQSGSRSTKAADIIQHRYPSISIYHLNGGLLSLPGI